MKNENRKSVWKFTPSRTDAKDLEFILVQRHQLLQDAVDRVRESVLTANKQHQLFVAPRGCGKTHLVTLIVSRLLADSDLTDRMRVAWLNEDETCISLLELLLKIHAALEKRYPMEYRPDMLGKAYDMPSEAAREFVGKHLLSVLDSRTLVVVVENLDAVFEGLGQVGQKQLRAFIQENPRFAMVATAQRLVEDISDRNNPFFGFFQTEHLQPLDVEEATLLLQNLARFHGEDKVAEFLSTSRGRARVRALHHLSGGNHRLYIVLSQFITLDSIDVLVEPFMRMVDELTPYYQERIHWLPPMQRRIVECLCAWEGTMPVKEIARRLFATPQTVSSQLQDLREKGYVTANQRGRESLYEVNEPLMRICVEVKDNQGTQPLRLLVDFLRVWYDEQELQERLGKSTLASTACAYLESAIQRNKVEGNLRKRLLLKELEMSPSEEGDVSQQGSLLKALEDKPEAVILAARKVQEGNLPAAIVCLDEGLAAEGDSASKAAILRFRGELHFESGDYEKSISDCNFLIEASSTSVGQKAELLVNRSVANYRLRKYQRSIDDCTMLIGLADAPVEQVAKASFLRGCIFLIQERKQQAQEDFEAVLRLEGVQVDLVMAACLFLTTIHFSDGEWNKGFHFLNKALEFGTKNPSRKLGKSGGPALCAFFGSGLSSENRGAKAGEMLGAYLKHQALSALGEAIVEHIGSVYRAGPPFPSSDNLDGWVLAWEQAAQNVPEFSLPLRLLRTGVKFIKAGGKDRGTLLDLNSTERTILEQALGLAENRNPTRLSSQ